MCGITGWFSPFPIDTHASVDRIKRMTATLAHRGPDGSGQSLKTHAALGHTRLSIIDIDGGIQPMSDKTSSVFITFNGEIYNFREIRSELIKQGVTFSTHSDTEVILNVYLQQGLEGFARLRGMYAFAIWDERTQKGFLARDPVGIKPLFYRVNYEKELLFGSEAKAILAGDKSKSLDESSLHLLMNFRYIPGGRSLFKDIVQLQPGQILEWDKSGKIVFHQHARQKPASYSGEIIVGLKEAVACHLTSDVEVATYLSGGIDSATITALASNNIQNHLRTFTLRVGDDSMEAENAAETSRLLDVENIQGDFSDDITQLLPRLIWHLEVPKINALQVNELARHASQYVKVALSGLGGDELFYGYNAHRIFYRLQQTNRYTPGLVTNIIGAAGASLIGGVSSPGWTEPERLAIILRKLGNWPKVYGLLRNVWDTPKMRTQMYGPRMLDLNLPNAFDVLEDKWPSSPDPVSAMAEYEWKEKMVNDLLWQEDRCSMAEGLEVRVPFLDSDFSSAVRALGRQRLMPKGRPKMYMKELVRPILPEKILNRRKSGFQVNAPEFFIHSLSQLAEVYLTTERIEHYGLFNPKFVDLVRAQKARKGLRWHYFILYLMLTTHIWLEQFEID